MIDKLTGLEPHAPGLQSDRPVQKFLGSILQAVPASPQQDLEALCRCWVDLTEASWVWFCLSHQYGERKKTWEILAISASESLEYKKHAKSQFDQGKSENSAASYCTAIERPVFVDDVSTWERTHEKQLYHVALKDELIENGCTSFLVVPVKFPSASSEPATQGPYSVMDQMSGAFCVHFTGKNPSKPLLSEEEYLLLSQATASAIANSYATEQRRILFKLNTLDAHYLTEPGLRSEERRRCYLGEVIKILQTHLHVRYVSFFWAVDDGNEVECIATTGLEGESGPLQADRIGLARYKRGERTTGRVFASGTEFVRQAGDPARPEMQPGKWRESPCDLSDDERVWVVWPISPPSANQKLRKDVSTLGVLRCVDNRARHTNDGVRPFDPIQLQTIAFIAAQLAPILDTMSANIRRDWTINFVKHDLYAPLRVIEDAAFSIEYAVANGKRPSQHTADNIKGAVALAKNLAGTLGEQLAFDPQPTLLESDIVARLRDGLSRFARVENRMTITYTGLRTIPRLNIDRSLVERAVCNLLINAIKYGYEDTAIDVSGQAEALAFVVRIENYGIGIKPGDEERVFEGTYRSPEAKSRRQGLGLGLKLARGAMRRNGGDLVLERRSDPTRFALIFPRSLAANPKER